MSEPLFIAIVDDDAAMRNALSDLLLEAGHASRVYASAPAFLAELAPGRFDLLITDLRMPRMDGFALLGRLKAMGAALPAIIVTSSETSCAEAIEAGAASCLTKPVDGGALLRFIDAALGPDREPPPAQ